MQIALNIFLRYGLIKMKRDLATIIEDELPKVNLKKNQLAKLIGLSGSHFTNVSNGRASLRKAGYQPEPEVVNKLAYHLNVSVEEILEGLGYDLTKVPVELVDFIEKYKNISESHQIKVLNILNTVLELILQSDKDKEIEPQIGKTKINGQEVNIRLFEPLEKLTLLEKG